MGKTEINKQSMYQKIMPTLNQRKEVESVELGDATSQERAEVGTHQSSVKHTLVNLSEYAIEMRLEEAFQKFKCCQCERCVLDVKAIALNALPVKYVVKDSIELEGALTQYSENVVPALVKAIMVVKNNPRH